MKTVLVTGCDGFTGQYVSRALEDRGYHVIRLVLENPTKGEIACDLTIEEEVREVIKQTRPEGVIHLAALSFVGHEDESAFYRVNIFSALNILKCLESESVEPEKIVIASSANVYGNPTVSELTEESPVSPVNHYAASKLAMEFMVKNWFSRFPIIITRPFNYTGPGQNEIFLVPKIVRHFRDHLDQIELGNLDIARDFSDVRDIARAYCMLLESTARSEIVNLSTGSTYSLNQIISLMNEIAGYEIKIIVNPAFVRKNEIKSLCGSNAKLVELIKYEPVFNFKRTLIDMMSAR